MPGSIQCCANFLNSSLVDFCHISDNHFPLAAAACLVQSPGNQIRRTSWYPRTSLNWDLLKRLRWLDTWLRHALWNQTLPGVSLQFGTAAVCQCAADLWPPREEKRERGRKATLDTDVEVFSMDAVWDAWGRGGSFKKNSRWIKSGGEAEPKEVREKDKWTGRERRNRRHV